DDQPKKSARDAATPELQELARRYVDLWQDQATALAADPAVAETLQRVMATFGVAASGLPAARQAWPAALASLMTAAQPQAGPGNVGAAAGKEQDKHGRASAATPGAAPAAAASAGGGTDLERLSQRLAALEQRLAALEGDAGTGGAGKRRT